MLCYHIIELKYGDKRMNNIFDQQNPRLLIRAMLTLKTEDECRAFLEDIMTTREILDISQRMAVARELDAGASTLKIAETTGASTATISRVNRCYQYGAGGYRTVLDRWKED